MRVLVVDDDELVRRTLFLFLRRTGVEPVMAASAEEALEIFGREPFPLVISDVSMPGMNGVELAHELRRMRPEVTLFAHTGSSGAPLMDQVPDAFDRVFRKPLEYRALVEACAEFVHPSRAPVGA